MWVSLLLASVVHIGQFTLFLQTSNETKVIVSFATFYMNWLFFFNKGSKIYRSFISFLIFSFLLSILMLLLENRKCLTLNLHQRSTIVHFCFSSVHSVVSDSFRPCGLQHARPPCPSPTPGVYSDSMSIESVMASNHLILCCPLLLPPSIFPSIRVFSNESVLHIRWPKYWSFSFSISPSNEYSGLISFRMDWLDLLAVQGTLKRDRFKWD